MRNLLTLLSLFVVVAVPAQKLKKEEKQILENLQKHIHYLAGDSLEGRRAGSAGEKLAAQYIAEAFKVAGLQPKGTEQFEQTFTIDEGRQINEAYLKIGDRQLVLHEDFFPLIISPNASLRAEPSVGIQEKDMPWFYDLKDLIAEVAHHPHEDLMEAIVSKSAELQKKGASALFLYNSTPVDDGLEFDGKAHMEPATLPIIYITKKGMKPLLDDESSLQKLELKLSIGKRQRTATNVIGYIDNGASTTVVMGAHYDHLGHGEDGNSREMVNKNQVHNGADDNASGTAALIELGKLLSQSKLKSYNYLFIAFSAEELGLFGSKYYTAHPTVDPGHIAYMVNMDMVGRLSDSTHVLTVGGYGTSPEWGRVYGLTGKNSLFSGPLVYRFDSSGSGPSDHTSFYMQNIPVLFYFTGLHPDYHKPTDDADRINYMGELMVIKHIYSLLEKEDKVKEKPVFARTRDVAVTSARFSVTLGIMPDYTFPGAGVRVDGVSDQRPAQKAGIQTGDVIIMLGDYKISSLEAYMQALGKFRKGDKTNVTYQRAGETLSADVVF